MRIRIIRADRESDKEIQALAELDEKILPHKSDLFNEEDWKHFRNIFEFFWIWADGAVVGSIHLGLNMEWEEEEFPTPRPGCLYSASLGILPEFQDLGIGSFAKQWQIDYAKSHGFKKILAYCRKSNTAMISLNEKFGFQAVREIPDFWEDPDEPGVVLELKL